MASGAYGFSGLETTGDGEQETSKRDNNNNNNNNKKHVHI